MFGLHRAEVHAEQNVWRKYMTKRYLFLAIMMCAVAGMAWAESSPLMGKWKLDPKASSVSGQADDKAEAGKGAAGAWENATVQEQPYVMEIASHENDGITLEYPSLDLTKSASFDGKDYPTTGAHSVKGETVSARRLNASGFEVKDKVDGKLVATSRFVISPDGKMLRVMVMTPGKAMPDVMVYERE